MQISELLASAMRSLLANRKRSLLTMIGIVIGISAVITIMALGNGVSKKVADAFAANQNGQIAVSIDYMAYDDRAEGITKRDLALIRDSRLGRDLTDLKITNLANGVGMGDVMFGDGEVMQQQFRAVDNVPQVTPVIGRPFKKSDLTTAQQVALIDREFAKQNFTKVGAAVGNNVTIAGASYRIIGVYEAKTGMMSGAGAIQEPLIVPRSTYLGTFDAASGLTLNFTVPQGKDPKKYAIFVQKLLKAHGENRANGDYFYPAMDNLVKSVSRMLHLMTYFVAAVAGISLFIAGIGVMNMMYISVSERTQEIGVRLAIGATEKSIRWQFLLESVMLTVSGGIVGLLLGWGVAMAVSSFLPQNIQAIVTGRDVLMALGVSSGVGIVFGWLPASQAAQKNLIDILR
jgi:putative ABC transport system permease protein